MVKKLIATAALILALAACGQESPTTAHLERTWDRQTAEERLEGCLAVEAMGGPEAAYEILNDEFNAQYDFDLDKEDLVAHHNEKCGKK